MGGHWFAAGDVQLHLVDADAGTDPGIQPTGPHVCFAVDDLDAAIAELERDGIPYVRGAQGTVVQIWFADPAGNTVEIQQDADRVVLRGVTGDRRVAQGMPPSTRSTAPVV